MPRNVPRNKTEPGTSTTSTVSGQKLTNPDKQILVIFCEVSRTNPDKQIRFWGFLVLWVCAKGAEKASCRGRVVQPANMDSNMFLINSKAFRHFQSKP